MMLLGTFRIGVSDYVCRGSYNLNLGGANGIKGDALIVSGGMYWVSNVNEPQD